MRIILLFAVALMTFTGHAEQPIDAGTRWFQLRPHEIVWSAKGSSRIRKDDSIEVKSLGDWQEFTLYFWFPKPTTVKHIRLEFLPFESSPRHDTARTLFEVKPLLKNRLGETTRLEFQDCKSLGQFDDDTTANCIDSLSDTGWNLPRSGGARSSHQLVLQLTDPVSVNDKTLFGLTIDSGGAPDVEAVSRIRISFADAIQRVNHKNQEVNPNHH